MPVGEPEAMVSTTAVLQKDRFGNPLALELPYARGEILGSTEDDFRKIRWAWKIMKKRMSEKGQRSVYNFTGLERRFPATAAEVGVLDDEVSAAVHFEELRKLALEHLGGVEEVHDVAVFNRLTAAAVSTFLAFVKRGDTVVGVSRSHSHPSILRSANLVGARFVDTVDLEGFRKALETEEKISLVALTRLAVTYEILEEREIKKIIELAKSRGTLVYMDDAGGARVGPAVFNQPKMLDLGVDFGSTGLDKYGTQGPRFGLMAGRKELVAKARAKGYEYGMEARPVFYPAVINSLQSYSPEKVRKLVETTKMVEKEVYKYLGSRISTTPTIFELKGEDILEIAMERKGLRTPPIVPYEASAALAMVLLKNHGIITVHFAGVPPGTSAILFKFINPDTLKRFGGAQKFAKVLNDSFDEVADLVSDRQTLTKTLFGDEA